MNQGNFGWSGLTPPIGGLIKVARFVLTAPGAIKIPDIPQDGSHLLIYWAIRGTDAAEQTLGITVNGDTGSNYYSQVNTASSSTAQAASANQVSPTNTRVGFVPPTGATAGAHAMGRIEMPFYTDTGKLKRGTFQSARHVSVSDLRVEQGAWGWNSTAAILTLSFAPAAGNCDVGSTIDLYLIR